MSEIFRHKSQYPTPLPPLVPLPNPNAQAQVAVPQQLPPSVAVADIPQTQVGITQALAFFDNDFLINSIDSTNCGIYDIDGM